ncbi:hypothetical protein [Rhizobium sp. SL86]|nr:hypothetical protein [Rhizobium sp. SL86]MCY1666307.1 hypothetical protein [Rhizobium sp. SL86]
MNSNAAKLMNRQQPCETLKRAARGVREAQAQRGDEESRAGMTRVQRYFG